MHDYIEFEVSLRDIAPRIWRRVLLRTDVTFEDFGDAIQDAFGRDGDALENQLPRARVLARLPAGVAPVVADCVRSSRARRSKRPDGV